MRGPAVLREVPLQALPHVGVVRELESGRHHAGYDVWRVAQQDRLADDRRIRRESLAPEPMRDHRDVIAGVERLRRKSAAEDWRNPKHQEEIAARFDSVDAHRIASRFSEIDLRIPPAGCVREYLCE